MGGNPYAWEGAAFAPFDPFTGDGPEPHGPGPMKLLQVLSLALALCLGANANPATTGTCIDSLGRFQVDATVPAGTRHAVSGNQRRSRVARALAKDARL